MRLCGALLSTQDERRYVEEYRMKELENQLGLTKSHLILLALLLGSDYAEGVK